MLLKCQSNRHNGMFALYTYAKLGYVRCVHSSNLYILLQQLCGRLLMYLKQQTVILSSVGTFSNVNQMFFVCLNQTLTKHFHNIKLNTETYIFNIISGLQMVISSGSWSVKCWILLPVFKHILFDYYVSDPRILLIFLANIQTFRTIQYCVVSVFQFVCILISQQQQMILAQWGKYWQSCSEACATVVISTRTHCVVESVILFEMQKYALYMIWLNASNYGL